MESHEYLGTRNVTARQGIYCSIVRVKFSGRNWSQHLVENLLVCYNTLIVLLIIRAVSCQFDYDLSKSCQKPLKRSLFPN